MMSGTFTREVAQSWEFAMVSGNGELGIMHYGEPHDERIVLSHAALFLPLPPKKLPNMSPYLEEVRRISDQQGYRAAHDFFIQKGEVHGHSIVPTDPFHPGLFLHVNQERTGHSSNYKRSVHFETGEVTSEWMENGTRFIHRMFASRVDKCVVMELTSEDSSKMDVKLSVEQVKHPLMSMDICHAENQLITHHAYVHEEGGYTTCTTVKTDGKVWGDKGEIKLSQITYALIFMKLLPFSNHEQEEAKWKVSQIPMQQNYEQLKASHAKLQGELFNRTSLHIGHVTDDDKSTEELFEQVSVEEGIPTSLIKRLYDAGRYMFISSTGLRPPNLQGIWTGTFKPSWSADYTLDTNLQLAMTSALSSHLPELMEPFFSLLESYLPDFRENAKKMFGARGILTGVRASRSGLHLHWGDASWGDRECDTFFGAFWTCGAGWLSQFFYDYYLYTEDETFLKERAIPFMKEVALFYEDFLFENEQGILTFLPSYSAENGIAANSTQDIAVAHALFKHLIDSCMICQVEQGNINKWRRLKQKLPPYLINEEGVLKEWAVEDHDEQFDHRHFATFHAIFQSDEWSEEKTPVLWQAAKRAFDKKLEHWLYHRESDTSTHGRMHAGLCAARFGMSSVITDILRMMIAGGAIYPSLMTAHYDDYHVFNVDGNGAIPHLLHEAMYHSSPGELLLFPALPSEWITGELKGVLCKGKIEIKELSWNLKEGWIQLILYPKKNQILKVHFHQSFQNNHFHSIDPVVVHLQKGQPLPLFWDSKSGCC
ncbi:glycosyl hydrolase family 95 catalytic domain-containing protein [Bacillus sp. NPDC077027]|uniref:glycosyl hydrolase family 95 catalytic domain-containing protein n=1 Tax=Bacillus sp. NPDC077027 TaxID=3390548 RepID=UPI003D04EDE1